MNADPNQLISGHLDGSLTSDEHQVLNDWIKADPANARRFAWAVMLDNRIELQYRAMQVTVEQFDNLRVPISRLPGMTRRIAITVSALCLLLAGFLYLQTPLQSGPSAKALSTFHELVIIGQRPADKTYRISSINTEINDGADARQKLLKNEPAISNERMLYVRDGREFVCTWKTPEGKTFITGSNDQESWSIPPNGVILREKPLHYTGGLPDREYLAPILNLHNHEEKVLAAFYNLELRKRSKTQQLLVAGKKPDTKDGPRRIEIDFDQDTRKITEMRIWPETLDHRNTSFTRIELVSDETLDPNWFTPGFHRRPGVETAAAAD